MTDALIQMHCNNEVEIQNNDKNQFISLRFSFSIYNTKNEIDLVVKEIKNLILKN